MAYGKACPLSKKLGHLTDKQSSQKYPLSDLSFHSSWKRFDWSITECEHDNYFSIRYIALQNYVLAARQFYALIFLPR